MKYSLFIILISFGVLSCGNHAPKQALAPIIASCTSKDVHTQSNGDSVILKHLDLDIKVDMQHKNISGCATWTIDNLYKKNMLYLDGYDLTYGNILVDGDTIVYKDKWSREDTFTQYLGSRLCIPIKAGTNKVSIYYSTGPKATALQWLDPQQTNDKKFPFLYTQSESIYARSWIPCADGPGYRFTYNARVQVPKGLMALMSAHNPQQRNDSGIYHFDMEIPVPAYLMALAVGDIAFKSIDERTGVYTEPGMLAKVAYEFADMGKLVNTAEKLYGPYRWGRYDVIVLPPGFPIGGMENPRLTFATPTIIAGDRSLVNLISHELAHSWSGNLVTNATWNDFWLNEGFTNYFERRISEAMNGKDFADMLWELGYQDFATAVNDLGANSKDTWLKLDLAGRDPDDGLTDIAYEKGAHFLKLIENTVGRPRFDSFLNKYFNEHAFKTISTEAFLQYLNDNLLHNDSSLYHTLNSKAWVYGPGIPANCPRVNPRLFQIVDSMMGPIHCGSFTQPLPAWSTYEWMYLLRKMPQPLTTQQMAHLDQTYHFTQSGNSEIQDLWYVMAIANNYKPAYPAMEKFLSRVGRRKFLEPLYTELCKTPTGKQWAKTLYTKYQNNYHPLARVSIQKILK
jgi:aminopeptidase N